jgi:hypothetical protein
MPMKRTKIFVCFKMVKKGKKFEILFFGCFQVENKVTSMYKISCLHSHVIKEWSQIPILVSLGVIT